MKILKMLEKLSIPDSQLKKEAKKVGLKWITFRNKPPAVVGTDRDLFMRKFGEQSMLQFVIETIKKADMSTKEKIIIWVACILATVLVLHPDFVIRFNGLLLWILTIIHIWARRIA